MLLKAATKRTTFYSTISTIFSDLKFNWFPQKTSHFTPEHFDQTFLKKYSKGEYYVNIAALTNDLLAVNTGVDIKPSVLGADMDVVTRNFGKAEYIFNDDDITIFVYHRMINGLRARCKVHFYKDKAFLLNNNYLLATEDQKSTVFKALGHKYKVPPIEVLMRRITDRFNNLVYVIDDKEGLMVNYLANKQSGWYDGFVKRVMLRQNQLNAFNPSSDTEVAWR